MKKFSLVNCLDYDITRPVCDMAAFFDYKMSHNADDIITVSLENKTIKVILQTLNEKYIAEFLVKDMRVSGEIIRCVKLGVLSVYQQFTKLQPRLPWGILTGVRPDKLVHKIIDSGVSATDVVDFMAKEYLLPASKGQLLTQIVTKQKQILVDATRLQDVAIYIGIPYCPSRCSYCSFPSGIVPQDEESQQNFVKLIEQDIKNVVQLLSMYNLNVMSLYIGGGTPTSLSDKVFANLLQIVKENLSFNSLREFTVEAGRPDCFSKAKLEAMEEAHVTRISVNPQTFHDKTLKIIGRNHTVADFIKAYDMVRNSKIPTINMDLIVGLPGETQNDIEDSLQRAIDFAPENLTIHALTLKKGAPLFNSYVGVKDTIAEELIEKGCELATTYGLEPYYLYRQHYMLGHLANIGYAKPGTESIYNIQMMEERHPIIGIGPSSASKRPLSDGHHINKLNMPKNIKVYAENLNTLFSKRLDLFK